MSRSMSRSIAERQSRNKKNSIGKHDIHQLNNEKEINVNRDQILQINEDLNLELSKKPIQAVLRVGLGHIPEITNDAIRFDNHDQQDN